MSRAFLADAVLVLHAGVVAFVVGGLVAIVVGNRRGWRWVNRSWFRLLHAATIAIVAAEAWLGVACPLTTVEDALRARPADDGAAISFLARGLRAVVFWSAPPWVFTAVHTAFAGLVALVWWRYPPRR